MSDGSLFNLSALESTVTTTTSTDASFQPVAPTAQSQSLYRKYRPQSFDEDDLFGQEHIVNTLRNAIALNRIAHAYLFCGPRGTGKTTTARLLAKAVNCLDPDPYKRPCNVCAACVAINKGATTDVIEIDAASNRGIDDIRDLRERVKYAPTQLRTKFYIIDEAHQITGAAANAFLKTLEEPPSHTKFILATTDPEELLQTIVSRCQRFDFRRINLNAMQACIRKVAGEEKIDIADEAVLAIARHATGSLRDALGLLDQVAVYRERDGEVDPRVTVDLVRTVLGVSRNDRVESIARALADRDPAAGLKVIGDAIESGEDMRQLGRQLIAYLRLLLLQRAGGTPDADDASRQLAERFELGEIADLVRQFADIDYKVKHSVLSQLPLELAVVEGAMREERQIASVAKVINPPASIAQEESPVIQRRPQSATLATPVSSRELREDLGNQPPPPPYEAEYLTERPTRPSLRDRVRGSGPANLPNSAPASPRVDEPARAPVERSPSSPGPTANGQQPDRPRYGSEPRQTPSNTQPVPVVPVSPQVEAPAPAAVNVSGEITLDTMVELWPKIRNDVKAVNRRIEALLQQIDPAGVAGDRLILVSPYEFHRNRVNSDEARTIIEDVIARLLKQRFIISCVTREEAQSMVGSRPAAAAAPAVTAPVAPTRSAAEPSVSKQEWAPPSEDLLLDIPEMDMKKSNSTTTASETSVGDREALTEQLDEQRIRAAKNIFDAEEVDDPDSA